VLAVGRGCKWRKRLRVVLHNKRAVFGVLLLEMQLKGVVISRQNREVAERTVEEFHIHIARHFGGCLGVNKGQQVALLYK
jgi:hypothetical protein